MADPFVVDPVAPERLSMSFVRASEMCLRRAHAERELDTSGEMAIVGHLFHEAAAAIGFACVARGIERPSPEEAARITEAVLRAPGEDGDPLSREVHDEVWALVERWLPRAVFQSNEMFEVDSRIEFGGRTLSARLDRVWLDDDAAHVRDYKTGWADPAGALTLQGEIYGLHAFARFGVNRVYYAEDHVRWATRDPKPFVITRDDVVRTESFLATAIARIDAAYAEGGELPATPGSACSSPTRCPVAGSCPKASQEPATWINSEAEAVEAFEALLVGEAAQDARKLAIRGWLAREERRALQHNGEEIGWADKPGTRFNERALRDDLEDRGGGIDLAAYRETTKPSFGRRKAK